MPNPVDNLDPKEKAELQNKILKTLLIAGPFAPLTAPPIIAQEVDQARKKHELKATLSSAFSHAGSKIVKVDDLMNNFDQMSSQFGFLGNLENKYELSELAKNGLPAVDGLYIKPDASGKPVAYVSSQFVEKTLVNGVDAGLADGHEDLAKRTGAIMVEAIQKSPDQSAAIKVATPKPKM